MAYTIVTDAGIHIDVDTSDAAQLTAAYDAWRRSARGSSAECHLWNLVIECADEYLDRIGMLDTYTSEVERND